MSKSSEQPVVTKGALELAAKLGCVGYTEKQIIQAALTAEREAALDDACWAFHCWTVDKALSQEIQKMCPADISYHGQQAIRSLKTREGD